MDVTQPSAAAATPTAKAAAAAGAKGPASEAEDAGALQTATTDFETFLTLLTTQLQNQDPLNPTDSTEFVAQLASFSQVEQQVRSNDQLEKIYEALGGGASSGLAAWIGAEVRAAAQASFTGDAVSVLADPVEGATRAVMTVTDEFGQTVATRDVSAAATTLTWDGRNSLGETQPDGLYSFSVASYKDDDLLETRPGEVFAKVTEVRIEDGETVLVLEGGAQAPVDSVTALR